MTPIKSEQIKRYGAFFQKLPWLAGERLFLSMLVSTLAMAIVGIIIFYQYAVQAPKAEPQIKKEVIRFQGGRFSDLMARWEQRQSQFNAALESEYPDPF
ncbi:MAG: hypothetical protein HYT21_01800 [Candidatus Nealsonbacteria bacterium]|nr:hypothetical protein [Candidatus Nealsonbacteria bacterium]